jgi:hypothetical protein
MEDDFQKEGNAATLALQTIPTPRKLQPLWNATSHCDEFYQLHHSLQLVPHL